MFWEGDRSSAAEDKASSSGDVTPLEGDPISGDWTRGDGAEGLFLLADSQQRWDIFVTRNSRCLGLRHRSQNSQVTSTGVLSPISSTVLGQSSRVRCLLDWFAGLCTSARNMGALLIRGRRHSNDECFSKWFGKDRDDDPRR